MAIESAADRAVFLNPDEFGVEVTWAGGAGPIAALPQTGTLLIGAIDGPDTQVREATIVVREADLPIGQDQGDEVTLNGVVYFVRSIEPDGTGMAVVRLEKADG